MSEQSHEIAYTVIVDGQLWVTGDGETWTRARETVAGETWIRARKVEDGHIHVGLDFIPVEERSPTMAGVFWILAVGLGSPREWLWMHARWWDGSNVAIQRVTHWAEIPVIKT